jgi:hypothetical protein
MQAFNPTEEEVTTPAQPLLNSNPVSITPDVRPAAKPPHPQQDSPPLAPQLADTPPAASPSGSDPIAHMRKMTRMREMDHGISYKPHYKASSKLVLLSSTQIKEAKVPFIKADPTLAEAMKILTVYLLVFHGCPDVVVHLTDKILFFPFKWWLEAFRNLFNAKPLKSPDNLIELRILVCRLASSRARYIIPTAENDPILQRINQPSRPSKAYWAACMTVGSLYYFPLRESQGSTQQTLFDTGFLTRPSSADSTNLEGTTPMEEDIPSPPPTDDSTPKLAARKSATPPDEDFTLVQTKTRRAKYKTDSKDLSKCRVRFSLLLPPQDEASADITKEIIAEGLLNYPLSHTFATLLRPS